MQFDFLVVRSSRFEYKPRITYDQAGEKAGAIRISSNREDLVSNIEGGRGLSLYSYERENSFQKTIQVSLFR